MLPDLRRALERLAQKLRHNVGRSAVWRLSFFAMILSKTAYADGVFAFLRDQLEARTSSDALGLDRVLEAVERVHR
jgi:hypothetical protein